MTQIATVEEIVRPGIVRIAVRRETACGHDCENCGGCGASGGQIIRVEAQDSLGVVPGETVLVESDTGQVLRAAVLVYLLPLITLFIGYAVGALFENTLAQIIVTAGGFLIGLLPALKMDRRVKNERGTSFRILERV